jgi:hypothetical protein
MTDMFNDSLDDIFAAPSGEVRIEPIRAPVDYTPRDFTEVCGKCGGSGSWRGRGQCFACKGVGRFTFKTSAETRAKGRAARTNRKARTEQDMLDAFAAEHAAVWAWLSANAERNAFAAKLVGGIARFGSLTEGQRVAVERSIEKDAARKVADAERVKGAAVADTAGVDRLKAAFDHAAARAAEKGRGLRGARITIGNMVISPAKAGSKNFGALYVKASGQYLGKVADGRFFAVRECGTEQQAKVLAFIADPKAAAIAYGQETGICCICNSPLTNKASVEKGIGPICEENMGW